MEAALLLTPPAATEQVVKDTAFVHRAHRWCRQALGGRRTMAEV